MKLVFASATGSDVAPLVELHNAAALELTRRFGEGRWSGVQTERGVVNSLRNPRFSRVLLARTVNGRLAGTLGLATKKPWAIDVAYFTAVQKPLYLTGMAVHPEFQSKGVGRLMLEETEGVARAWPADAIRLDAFDADAGAGSFYSKCGFREVARVSYKQNPLIYFELVLPSLITTSK
jgi:GNAT superfamily N-acetyltransferase